MKQGKYKQEFTSESLQEIRQRGVSKVQQHAPKGQKPIAQGNALGNNKNKTKGAL